MGKRIKTQYPGVFYKVVRRIGGKTGETEKSYYIIFKKDRKNIEEHCGYQHRDAMTPSKASKIRGERIEHRRKSRKAIRKAQEADSWTFDKLWTHYLSKRPDAAHSDRSRFNTYIKGTIGNVKPSELEPHHLDPINELLKEKAPGTQYAVLQLINRISTYGKKKMLCDPIKFFIELPKVEAERTEQLTDRQFKDLLTILREDGRDVAKLMELALSSGMRRGEMLSLKWINLDLENGFIRLAKDTTKSKKNAIIPMNSAARNVLESLDPDTDYVFQGLQNRSDNWIVLRGKLLIAKAGLPDDFRPFHGLRHAFASMLASQGVEIYKISKLLTHKNLAMTSRYAHLSDQSLKDASNVAAEIFNGKD